MASHVYDNTTLKLSDGTVTWGSSTIKVALVNTSYVFSTSHTSMSDITHELSGTGYSRKTLSGKTTTLDSTNHRTILSASNVTWTAITAGGDTAAAAVVFEDPGTGDANCILLGYIDLSPHTVLNGGDFTVAWDSTNGIMDLTAS
jgi:hypothetical protein